MKYQSGFVPVQFYKMGLVFIILGLLGIALGVTDYFFSWEWLSDIILYIGIGLTLIGLYLRKFAPKDESK